jgi:TetR/AcrR family tetracycline transcriptional repressor
MKLDQSRIIETGLAIIDERGLDALNMRAVAQRLGVQASALYWHVGNKDELLSLMAGHFYREALKAVPPGAPWREWLMDFGKAFRGALVAHRDSARLCALARPVAAEPREAAARTAAPLMDAGLQPQTALAYQASVISLTLGWAVYEQSETLHDFLAETVGFDRGFMIGLEALVRGFP